MATIQIVLVRHAMPVVEKHVPAEAWRLDDEGRAAARAMSSALPEAPFGVASAEPKAIETAQAMLALRGGALTIDERVGETRRPHRWSADFADLVTAFLNGRQHDGWESRAAVARRFDAAVRASLGDSRGAPVVIFDHGQALTLWLQYVGAIDDAAGFWSNLTFPDVWRVTLGDDARAIAPPVRLVAA